jgi:hypothetical protein
MWASILYMLVITVPIIPSAPPVNDRDPETPFFAGGMIDARGLASALENSRATALGSGRQLLRQSSTS